MSFASLADVVPSEWVRPVEEWFVREVTEIIEERDRDYEQMRLLGVNGNVLDAHRRATSSLSEIQGNWQRALNPPSDRSAA